MNDTKKNGSNLPAVFSFGENNKLTAFTENDEIWFIAKDICEILGLNNVTKAVRALDPDELKIIQVVDKAGRKNRMNVVNESGMYALIMRSNKPEAKAFRKWVTGTVLPELRRTGRYDVRPMAVLEEKPLPGMDIRFNIQQRFAAACKIAGSQNKLMDLFGYSNGVASFIMHPDQWHLVSSETWLDVDRKLNSAFQNLNINEALLMIVDIEDVKKRKALAELLLRKGGVA